MQKQFNPLLSFPVMIKQTIYLKNQARALEILLKKYSQKEINQIMPIAIQEYLKSKQFDQDIAQEAKMVLQKYKQHFLALFQKQIKDIQKLNAKIETTYAFLDQAKKNVNNRKLFQCQLCEKSYPTANGLHYHKHSQHPGKKTAKNQPFEESQPRMALKSKKIKKQQARENIHNQESQMAVEQGEQFLQ